MKVQSLLLAAAVIGVQGWAPAMAQYTTIETRSMAFTLPAGPSYIVVDPATGKVFGNYSAEMRIPAGYYVAEQTSGKVIAAADPSGGLVAISTITPSATLSDRIVVQNGTMVYLVDDYSVRRSLLSAKVDAEYAAGRLTKDQVSDLKSDLRKIASLESKRKKDGTYSSSRRREIEERLAEVNEDLQEGVLRTNRKRASLGIITY